MRKRRRKLRVILDDGTPMCLPAWARDEIASRRLSEFDLRQKLFEAEMALADTKAEKRTQLDKSLGSI